MSRQSSQPPGLPALQGFPPKALTIRSPAVWRGIGLPRPYSRQNTAWPYTVITVPALPRTASFTFAMEVISTFPALTLLR